MLSQILGLMAASAIALAEKTQDPNCLPPEPLLPCGNAFYVASQYTCYDGDNLCPVLNGQPTSPCGPDCYLPTMYSCDGGKLAPPQPTANGSFQLTVGSELVEASGLVFRIGGGPPSTYCPSQVSDVSQCPPGTDTEFSCEDGYCSLNVEVPGGQQVYVAPNGAVSYTQAHSGYAPPGSEFSGFSQQSGALTFAGNDFYACPPADGSSDSQLYVGSQTEDCLKVSVYTAPANETGFAAWQYT